MCEDLDLLGCGLELSFETGTNWRARVAAYAEEVAQVPSDVVDRVTEAVVAIPFSGEPEVSGASKGRVRLTWSGDSGTVSAEITAVGSVTWHHAGWSRTLRVDDGLPSVIRHALQGGWYRLPRRETEGRATPLQLAQAEAQRALATLRPACAVGDVESPLDVRWGAEE
jgi:hypothetical protein